MIFSFINTLFISILFADMLQRRYPEQFQMILIELSFNCIYLFSKFQIIFIKINNKLNQIIEENPTLLKFKNDINNILQQKSHNLENQIQNFDEYGFKILNVYENGLINKKIVYNDDDNDNNNIEISELKFILVEFLIGETHYKIELKTDTFNYYLVGNKFTKDFFIFYLKHHLIVNDNLRENENENEKYSLNIIDNNINKLDFDFTDKNEFIVLEKSGYKLLKNNDN